MNWSFAGSIAQTITIVLIIATLWIHSRHIEFLEQQVATDTATLLELCVDTLEHKYNFFDACSSIATKCLVNEP